MHSCNAKDGMEALEEEKPSGPTEYGCVHRGGNESVSRVRAVSSAHVTSPFVYGGTLETREERGNERTPKLGHKREPKRWIAYLASLLKILGDLFTAICDGDLSISLVSAPAFSNTWNRDFTFRLDNSSRPRSGLSEAAILRRKVLTLRRTGAGLYA